jgi:hypothetical protein
MVAVAVPSKERVDMASTLEDLRKFVADSQAAGKRVFFTSRSAIIARQRCPRFRWLKYHYNGTGLQKTRLNIPLSTGIYTHVGMKLLLEGVAPLAAAEQSLALYDEEVTRRGLEVEQTEDQFFVAAEQRAILEAFVWLAHYRVIPDLRRDYEVVEVEKDDWFLLYEDASMVVVVETRGDALLREKAQYVNTVPDGVQPGASDLYVLSWKTAKQWDKRKLRDARVDMQGISEAYATELRLQESVLGVKMVHLIKGVRREDTYRPGLWTTRSPLIRPWMRSTGPSPEFAWSWEWEDPNEINPGTGRYVKHTLGKGWKPTFIPDVMPMREWIEMLHSKAVQPEAGDCLEKQYVTPMPEARSEAQKKAWLRQTTGQEVEMAQALIALDGVSKSQAPEDVEEALDLMFPQYTHSCTYPAECEMFQICHGGEDAQEASELLGEEAVNPMSLYQAREPHHPGELGDVEE